MRVAHVFLPVDLPPPSVLAASGAPGLARLLARAHFRPRAPGESGLLEARLCARFGPGREPDDLPVACLTAPFDGLDPATHPLRADPVCLRPDLVDVALLPGHPPGLSCQEAQALIEEVNTRLGDGGLRLAPGASPLRWYLESTLPLDIRGLPPRAVAGRGTREHLPTGADRRRLLGWLTEVQFLLHASPVNAARAARGLPPVNSLWLWGGGAAGGTGMAGATDAARDARQPVRATRPQASVKSTRPQPTTAALTVRPVALYADCVLTQALARAAGVEREAILPLAALAPASPAVPAPFLVVDDPGPGAVLDYAAAEASWAAPLLSLLQRGRVSRVVLDTPAGQYTTGRLDLLRFWKRP